MSYSIKEARLEIDDAINMALHEENSTQLHRLASILKNMGDDEEAERLHKIADRIHNEGMEYDIYNER